MDTPWTADWDDTRAAVRAMAPLRRPGVPAECAEVIHALVTSSYVTGEVWVVDGGLALR